MKSVFICLAVCSAALVATGCDTSGQNGHVADGATQSQIDEYNRMVEEGYADMEKGDQAAVAAGAQ